MFFLQVLQVDFLADFQFTQVYTGLLFLPPDVIQSFCRVAWRASHVSGKLLIVFLDQKVFDSQAALLPSLFSLFLLVRASRLFRHVAQIFDQLD